MQTIVIARSAQARRGNPYSQKSLQTTGFIVLLTIVNLSPLNSCLCYNFNMTLLEDDFLNRKFISRLKKEVQQQQLEKTIDEISYLNNLQQHVLQRVDLSKSENEQLDFIKKLNNARKNLQIQA